jgi:putative chitinase
MITTATLVACGVGPTQARTFAEPLALACESFSITTRHRVAGFLGQYLVETDNLTALEEVLYYRSADRIATVFKRLRERLSLNDLAKLARNPRGLGDAAYAGVNGNGDAASGDGWRYRGRGLPHLTGRGNYAAAAAGLGRPYVESPELVTLPPDACLTGAWYWSTNGCNPLADTAQWDAITRKVNGPAMMKRDERRSLSDDLLQVLP